MLPLTPKQAKKVHTNGWKRWKRRFVPPSKKQTPRWRELVKEFMGSAVLAVNISKNNACQSNQQRCCVCPAKKRNTVIDLPILLEDESLLVIEKPAGVVVNRAENVTEPTVQDWAVEKLGIRNKESGIRDEEKSFYDRAGIVHRLDKETSGILLLAKTPEIFADLQQQFFQRTVQKTYLTLVHGAVAAEHGTVNAPVGRLPWNRRKFGVLPDGREAVTEYHRMQIYHDHTHTYTMLQAFPHTGRTHQIRIHLKHAGHSIVADELYSGRHLYAEDTVWCPRLFLHAARIRFQHPVHKTPVAIESPLPHDLQDALNRLSPH